MANFLLTPRDVALLSALARVPLTVPQLLTLSVTFPAPFTSVRRLQDRLHRLGEAELLRRWTYATEGPTVQHYYTLSRTGYRFIVGEGAPSPGQGVLGPIGIARQHHTRCLADFLVHTFVACAQAGVAVSDFERENALRLTVDGESLFPDSSFMLLLQGQTFRFFVEVDNATEPVTSPKTRDSWERKLRFYERLQDASAERFRVLAVATKGGGRLEHILETAASVARNPQRSLCYGIPLADYLAEGDPVQAPCFRDHRQQPVSLIPARDRPVLTPTAQAAAAALAGVGGL